MRSRLLGMRRELMGRTEMLLLPIKISIGDSDMALESEARERNVTVSEAVSTNESRVQYTFKFTKYLNAYVLVYIGVSDKDKIICNVDEKDIAENLRKRLKNDQEEMEDKRRYKTHAHLYTIIKVARDVDLKYFELVDHDKVCSFQFQKHIPFNQFKRDQRPKVSDNAKDLVKKMLNPNVGRRPTAQQDLEHPRLQNVNKAPNVSLNEIVFC
ncbi:calcium-dependent protein kinase family protein [Striga asiatica]|uniref:Calcium-dependent protein kinase family protein n=1 Tax=Striga asiatica TaxID=4170 RepID=A0A5A7PQ09_STRAF|nr:calcium-dependent protein kinase family protein [Striga asiatica]